MTSNTYESKAGAEMLDYRTAARLINVTLGTLYSMVARGEIPFVRLGRRLVRFPRPQLEAWIESNTVTPAPKSGGAQ